MTKSSDVLIGRVRFDVIGKTESGHELRAWTDGDRVVWEDDEGRSGSMPAMLFRLAALTICRTCEEIATGQDDASGVESMAFREALDDSIRTPIELAAAHPYWRDPDDARNDLKCGFASVAISTALDAQPEWLKPKRSG